VCQLDADLCIRAALEAKAVVHRFWRTLGAVARNELTPFRINTHSRANRDR